MLNFWLYRGQTGKNDPILLAMVSKCLSSKYSENHMRCLVTMVTQQRRSVNGHKLSHCITMLHIANYSEFEMYLPDEHFQTIASKDPCRAKTFDL